MATLPGYSPWRSGEVLAMSRLLPWWRFARQKVRSKA
jgi:putative molybdopterin biosynthesis protein